MDDFKFKKSFGQNFLNDNNILENIVNSADIKDNSLVIEIGPGSGALTKYLAKDASKVLAYEIDTRLEDILDDNLREIHNVDIIFDDFLNRDIKEDIRKYQYDNIYVIANIPYYITTPIILKLIESRIDFNVAHSNHEADQIASQKIENENDDSNYSNVPTFYTDCSDPITLSFVNDNIMEHLNYKNKYVPFSGAILDTAHINLNAIKPHISFDVHLFNNYNEEYIRSVYLDVEFEKNKSSITDGYIIQYDNYENGSLSFLKK